MACKSILALVVAFTCSVSAAPQAYQATGVLQPDTGSTGNYEKIISSTIDILPEITDVFQQITTDSGRSNPSDPAFVERVISAFLPISKKVLVASAKAEGKAVQLEQLEALNAAEAVMPAVFRFMETLRNNDFFGTGTGSQPSISRSESTSQFQNIQQVPGQGLGRYENIVSSTVDVLPDIASVFKQINSNPARSDPSNPEFIQNVIMAFLPVSKKLLVDSAKAEGRTVRQDELDRLNAAEAVMPSVFQFMERLRQDNFFGTGSQTRSTSNVPAQTLPVQRLTELMSARRGANLQESSYYSPAAVQIANPVVYSSPSHPGPSSVVVSEILPASLPVTYIQPGHASVDSAEDDSSSEDY